MRLLRNPSRSPTGLDIGGRHVKAVQLEKAHGGTTWRLAAAAYFPRISPGAAIDPAELRNIAHVLDRRGFAGNRVVIAVPSEKLMAGVLDTPARSAGVPVEQIARMELARTHRCQPDAFEMGCWDLPAANRANRAPQLMAVGCAHHDANAVLDQFSAEHLDVVALDVRSCALARAAAPLSPSDAAVWAILDVGWASATVVVMYAGAVVYVRSMPDAGTRSLYESLHSRLGMDSDVADYLLNEVGLSAQGVGAGPARDVDVPPEARKLLSAYVDSLAQELQASLSYIGHEYPDASLASMLLCGSNAAIPGLAEQLARVLGLEVRAIALPQLLECPPALLESGSSPALTAAAGLAQFNGE